MGVVFVCFFFLPDAQVLPGMGHWSRTKKTNKITTTKNKKTHERDDLCPQHLNACYKKCNSAFLKNSMCRCSWFRQPRLGCKWAQERPRDTPYVTIYLQPQSPIHERLETLLRVEPKVCQRRNNKQYLNMHQPKKTYAWVLEPQQLEPKELGPTWTTTTWTNTKT